MTDAALNDLDPAADNSGLPVADSDNDSKRVFVKTYGCQMNVYDSERMSEALARDGYRPTTRIEDADLVVLNTCHIRERAAEKVYSELGRVRQIRDERRAVFSKTINNPFTKETDDVFHVQI